MEPDRHYIATIMDDVPKYLSVPDVRKLLAKLLAAGANTNFKDIIHPAIVETVKQLTPHDVKLIKILNDSMGFAAIVTPVFRAKGFEMEIGIEEVHT